tara:strand:- start:170 stop:469 length:300 start_codon:yes stop_codon:yes gene_type:complete
MLYAVAGFTLAIATHEAWWSQTGSNRRPPECKSGALPTELWPHLVEIMKNEAVKEQAKFILYDQLQPVPRGPRRAWNVWDSTISVVPQLQDAGFSLERR